MGNSISVICKVTLPVESFSKSQKKPSSSHHPRRAVRVTMANTMEKAKVKARTMVKKTNKPRNTVKTKMNTRKVENTMAENQLCSHSLTRTRMGSTRQNKRKRLPMVMHK